MDVAAWATTTRTVETRRVFCTICTIDRRRELLELVDAYSQGRPQPESVGAHHLQDLAQYSVKFARGVAVAASQLEEVEGGSVPSP